MRRAVLLLLVLASCTQERDGGGAPAPTWQDDVAPVAQARCVSCHSGATPAGSYDLSSYLGALGPGTDHASNAIAGDASSQLLATIAAGGDHADFADVLPLLTSWVVDGRVGYFDSPVHPPGILDRTSGDFHGLQVQQRGWDFSVCQQCHGDDFAGGKSGVSCRTCHTEEAGPTACDTCHEARPTSGPHPKHLAQGFACTECHKVPTRWDDPGHLGTPPADVTFGPLAARDLDPPRRTGPPSFDPVRATCSNVYCHGGVFDDTAARASSPVWTLAGGQAACGGCHGTPPSDHAPFAPDSCARCHRAQQGDHMDGHVELGDDSGTCSACHGDATTPAPTAGAHRQHLAGLSLGRPVQCDQCHVVPTTVTAPGHVDSDLPAEVTMAQGTWDGTTCTNTYCHGAAAPVWTDVGHGEAACGTCHGIPPTDPVHDPSLTVFDCITCHPAFSDGMHINGNVDVNF